MLMEDAVKAVANGAVEVNVDWWGRAADVDSVPALKAAIAESETFRELHVGVRATGDAAV